MVTKPRRELMRFRILAGTHVERTTFLSEPPKRVEQGSGPEINSNWDHTQDMPLEEFKRMLAKEDPPFVERTYTGPWYKDGVEVKAGDVIETYNDLSKQNGKPPCAPKFQRLFDGQVYQPNPRVVPPSDNLGELSLDDLRNIADQEEIDISGVAKIKDPNQQKLAIIKILRGSKLAAV